MLRTVPQPTDCVNITWTRGRGHLAVGNDETVDDPQTVRMTPVMGTTLLVNRVVPVGLISQLIF